MGLVAKKVETKKESDSAAPLFDRTVGAFTWRFLSESSTFALRLLVTVVLARLLPVDAFGLVTLAMIVVNFAFRVSQIGMGPALIQRKDLTETHIRVAFTVSILSGILLTTVIWAAAPFAAAAFRNPSVTPVLRLISISFLFSSLGTTAESLIERKLDYRKLFKLEMTSYSIGYALTGVALALLGFGVWALAWATVIESILRAALLFAGSPHTVRPSLARREASQLLNFGVGSSLSRIANYAAVNGDYFVVGRWLGAADLGFYSRAYQLISLPMYQFSSVISNVLFPAYSIIQNDTEGLRRAYIASVSFSSFLVIPALVALAIAAPEVMAGVFGPQWIDATVPLQILCLGGIFHSTYTLGDSLARAKGAVYLKFACHTIYAVCVITGSIIGTRWGTAGVAISVNIALAVIYILLARLSIHLTKSRWKEFFLSQLPGAMLGAGVAAIALPVALALRAAELPHLLTLACTLSASVVGALAAWLTLSDEWLNKVTLGAMDKVKRYCSSNLKNGMKSLLRRNERAFKAVEVIYDNLLLLRLMFRNGSWRVVAGFRRGTLRRSLRQTPMTWKVSLPDCDSPGELIDWFRSKGIEVSEGGHTFYIPPQERLSEIIPSVAGFYPAGSGFKVLKDFRHPSEAMYLYNHRESLIVLKRLLGRPQDRLIAANLLYALSIGPKVWDVTCWEAGSIYYSVFVVEHVSGKCPTTEQCASFLNRLRRLNNEGLLSILIPKWEESMDFTPPHCNNNLIYSERIGQVRYIDFQNFDLISQNSWSQQLLSDARRELIKNPNGQLNGDARICRSLAEMSEISRGRMTGQWSFVTSTLRKASINLSGRIVLDIGCGSGTMLHASLIEGAAWGIGWDRPSVVAHSEKLLLSMGTTRFTLIGADTFTGRRLEDDIPVEFQAGLDQAILFCRSARDYDGLIEKLSAARWRALVYEGSESERVEDFFNLLRSSSNDKLEIIASTCLTYDNSSARPACVILRG